MAFVFKITTTASPQTFTIPCQNVGTFNATVDWGDGGATSSITAYNDGDLAHSYATAGQYTITITGTFPNIYFNNAGDKLLVDEVVDLGDVGWTKLNSAFYGCSNMTSFGGATANTSLVTNMQSTFYNCSSLTSLDVSNWDTSLVADMRQMFNNCTNLSGLVLHNWNVEAVTDGTSFCSGANNALSTEEYNQILINWSQQSVQSGVSWHFGDATYSAPDKAQVFAGVRKLSDAATGVLAELSATTTGNAGSFYLAAPESTTIEYSSLSRGSAALSTTQRADFDSATAISPITSVLSATLDISGDLSTIRHNATEGTDATGNQGTGNYLAYPLYIGQRAGTTYPFNGRLYQMVVRFGPNLTDTQIQNAERYINSKTKAY